MWRKRGKQREQALGFAAESNGAMCWVTMFVRDGDVVIEVESEGGGGACAEAGKHMSLRISPNAFANLYQEMGRVWLRTFAPEELEEVEEDLG